MNGGPGDGMSRIVALMFRWPVDVFVTGVDLFVGGLRELRAALDPAPPNRPDDPRVAVAAALAEPTPAAGGWMQAPDWPTPPPAAKPEPHGWCGSGTDKPDRPAGGQEPSGELPSRQETRPMPGIDLGGDDIKNVSYWITFVRPDFVATLQPMQDETIDYATDEGSFGGLKLGGFFQKLQAGKVPWPKEWGTKKPSAEFIKLTGLLGVDYLKDIPEKERKYIRFNVKLNWRQPSPDSEREKDKVDALRDIRDEIQKMSGS